MEHGVARLITANTPAIEDHQDDGTLRPVQPARSACHVRISSKLDRSSIAVLSLAIERGYRVSRDIR